MINDIKWWIASKLIGNTLFEATKSVSVTGMSEEEKEKCTKKNVNELEHQMGEILRENIILDTKDFKNGKEEWKIFRVRFVIRKKVKETTK